MALNDHVRATNLGMKQLLRDNMTQGRLLLFSLTWLINGFVVMNGESMLEC